LVTLQGVAEGHVVVAVQEDHRRARHRTGGAEADHGLAQRCVLDHREVGRQRVADRAGGVRAWRTAPTAAATAASWRRIKGFFMAVS
jgi:hypothetical protein